MSNKLEIKDCDVFGFLKTETDVHTMGIANISNLLRRCGYATAIAPPEVLQAAEDIKKINNGSLFLKWIKDNRISILSFSYRLDPREGADLFLSILTLLKDNDLCGCKNAQIKMIAFAGLPDTCRLVERRTGSHVILFPGGENAEESLMRYGIPADTIARTLTSASPYDKFRNEFAQKFIESESYRNVLAPDHLGYPDCGTSNDSYLKRLDYCMRKGTLPIIRVHAGPYSPDRLEALKEFNSWARQLAASHLLDVLSIGSSQLTQQHFGENWEGMLNGGGVPVNSEIEYRQIAESAKPMLVRTYAGTKDVPWMARMHERTLNISWHALSYWWFCELDGRGNNTLLENLKQHIETIRYIATTGKPLEPNVPHHFAFRGSDDVSYIVSAFLAAKTAKINGIKHLILQNMLNTPKETIGVQDVAKARVMLRLVRSLEDSTFNVSLQCRAGLEYFAPDLERAKVQLAAVTAMMDDIEPDNPRSPEIIHVVSYSEAVRLATPDVIHESIKIVLGVLKSYRMQKSLRINEDAWSNEINLRAESLFDEAYHAIMILEDAFPDLYSAEGLCRVFKMGFLPVPYLMDSEHKFSEATKWTTACIDGGIKVVDDKGNPIYTPDRYLQILQA